MQKQEILEFIITQSLLSVKAGGPTNIYSFGFTDFDDTTLVPESLSSDWLSLHFVQSPNLIAWIYFDTHVPLRHNRMWVDIVNYYVAPSSCLIIRYAMSMPLQFWILSYRRLTLCPSPHAVSVRLSAASRAFGMKKRYWGITVQSIFTHEVIRIYFWYQSRWHELSKAEPLSRHKENK